ncbi:hydroxylamine reductase [Candidatus Bathyarchaeota archaeon]|nr:hydroxylamine reductase [Candidatus Bathyarchaeota archaeon]
MFCFQCEQTAKGTGCTTMGVCGKNDEVATLQDLLIYALKGLSIIAYAGRKEGIYDWEIDRFISKAAFATLTNVNFDPERISNLIFEAVKKREYLQKLVKLGVSEGPAVFQPASLIEDMVQQGRSVGIRSEPDVGSDVHSLKWSLIYCIKGISAYADHAAILGKEDAQIYAFIQEALAATANYDLGLNDYLDLVMKAGEINLRAMELLDSANTSNFGNPIPTKVPLGHKKGKAILISGHDFHDLDLLLKQTVDSGVFVYTHGEMLPAHGYPNLKKYSHFYGHYGTAWQNQIKEFNNFPGSILMTTNCIQRPAKTYKENIFTTGEVGWPEVVHISDKNFEPVIKKALELPGFIDDEEKGNVTVGFGHNAIMNVAPKIIDLIKQNKIRHFFLVAGCDGAKLGRNYYTEFVEKVPEDCIVLTLACGKFRFFTKQLGEIEGIPRLIDIGQCNDAYSAIQIAIALSKAFGVSVNELPLSMILSWYEQKAVAILVTLLYLGIKNIRLGPSLPAFFTPNVLKLLVEKYNIMPISTPEEDLKAILG